MKKIFIYMFLIINILSFTCTCFASQPENIVSSPNLEIPNINDLTIYSDCILMVEKETGDILYEKNAYQRMYPASTTKTLTAIIVLEKCSLNEMATVSSTALKAVPPSYTTSNIQAGEKFRIEDLLYAMLLPSANDAANVLAEHVAGSISGFADIMNEKAREIGCTESNFTNPSGIHDENLYTTAHDLSLIARYAMNIKTFRKIVSTTSYTLPSTSIYPNEDRVLTLSNSLITPGAKDYYYEYATGVKTGYTNAAKDCLIASAKKDNIEFIIVVLGAGHINGSRKTKYLDCKSLFNFAFDNYTSYYKNLQEEKEREKEKKLQEEAKLASASTSDTSQSNDNKFVRGLSKIIAVIAIILALRILFRRPKKKKNHYKYGGKKKSKHKAKHH